GSDFQLSALLDRGLYSYGIAKEEYEIERASEDTRTPFDLIDKVYEQLENYLYNPNPKQNFNEKIKKLCRLLQNACSKDTNAAIGTILLCTECNYPVVHSIHSAIVAEVVLKSLGWADEERMSVLAGALTMNIAMVRLQDTLHTQRTPLSEAQKTEIHDHPNKGTALLKQMYIDDNIWLDIVSQHHELLDGSGYHLKLKSDSISQPSRIVTLADIYCAKISSRAYREALLPNIVLKELFLKKEHCIDTEYAKLLVKKLGVYPPGTFVQLNSNETAVVIRVGKEAHCPVVQSIISSRGAVLTKPVERDTCHDGYQVNKVISRKEANVQINRSLLWGYI
ncbi:MAG: hypothetical protein LLF86_01140, partial [Nitrospiraceae bacterium]|nr:hypothetical protein [Nitrospiraceae bacterium]